MRRRWPPSGPAAPQAVPSPPPTRPARLARAPSRASQRQSQDRLSPQRMLISPLHVVQNLQGCEPVSCQALDHFPSLSSNTLYSLLSGQPSAPIYPTHVQPHQRHPPRRQRKCTSRRPVKVGGGWGRVGNAPRLRTPRWYPQPKLRRPPIRTLPPHYPSPHRLACPLRLLHTTGRGRGSKLRAPKRLCVPVALRPRKFYREPSEPY